MGGEAARVPGMVGSGDLTPASYHYKAAMKLEASRWACSSQAAILASQFERLPRRRQASIVVHTHALFLKCWLI
jgi:hypothetical protein